MNSEGRSTADHIEARVSDNDQMLNVFNDSTLDRREHQNANSVHIMRDSNNSVLLDGSQNHSNADGEKSQGMNDYMSFDKEEKEYYPLNAKNQNNSGTACYQKYPKRNQSHGNLQKKDMDEEEESKFTYEKGLLEILGDTSQDDQGLKKNEISKPDDLFILYEESKAPDSIKDPRKLRKMGNNLINLITDGNYGEALKYLEEACDLDPSDYENHRNKIDILFRIGKYTEVIRCCDQLLASGQKEPDIYAWKGLSEVRLGKRKQAKDYFDQALSTESSGGEFSDLGIKAQAQAFLGKADEALETAEKALKEDPCDSTFYYSKGMVLLQQEKYEEALKCAEEAINLNENYSEANYCKGSALLNLCRYEKAIDCLTKAIQQNPTNHRYYVARACAWDGSHQSDKVVEDEKKSYDLCKDDPIVFNNRANSLNWEGKSEEAFENIDRAIELDPKNNYFYCNKGEFKMAAGQKEEALDCFNTALHLGESKHIYFWRGKCLRDMGRTGEAIADFVKVQELKPVEQFGFNDRVSDHELAWMDEKVELYMRDIIEKIINIRIWMVNLQASVQATEK